MTFEEDYLFHYWFDVGESDEKGRNLDDLWIFDWDDGKPILERNALTELTTVNLYKLNGWSTFLTTSDYADYKLIPDTVIQEREVLTRDNSDFAVEQSFFRGTFAGWPIYRDNPDFTYTQICETLARDYDFTPKKEWNIDPSLELARNQLSGITFEGQIINEITYQFVSEEIDNVIPNINADNVADFINFADLQ